MRYAHVISYVASQLWAIDYAKFEEMLAVLAFRSAGQSLSADEIQARIGDRNAGAIRQPGKNVAVVPIRGVIAHRMGSMDDSSGGTSTERIGAMLRQAASDPSVGTILFDVDSPGGTVTGVPELAQEVANVRAGGKRIVSMVNGMAGSAAYWLASQADEIVSIPSGMAGSIGVFTAHKDLSKALANEGVDVTLISAGKYKVEGNPFQPLSDEAKAVIQSRVDASYQQFVSDVARGRGTRVDAVTSGYGEGRALDAAEALKAGLIDRIATVDETIGGLLAGHASSSTQDRRSALLL